MLKNMKRITNYIYLNLKANYINKQLIKGNLEREEKVLKLFSELGVEWVSIMDYIKQINFKDFFNKEHQLYLDMCKENQKLKRNHKNLEKEFNEYKEKHERNIDTM